MLIKSQHTLDATQRDYCEVSSKSKSKGRVKPRAAAMKRRLDQRIEDTNRECEIRDPRFECNDIFWSNIFR